MDDEIRFEPLFQTSLDVDDDRVQEQRRRGEAIIDDRDIAVLRHQNRIALAKGPTTQVSQPDHAVDGDAYYDVPLTCVVHAAPRCKFRWARLVVDLSATAGARIRDMAPREVRGDKPVELKTTIGLGLRFETLARTMAAEIKPEYSTSQSVYFPQILTSGPSFTRGYWDFRSGPGEFLHSNRILRLLVSAPAAMPLMARFRLRAEVGLAGAARIVPLLSRSGEIDDVYRLA